MTAGMSAARPERFPRLSSLRDGYRVHAAYRWWRCAYHRLIALIPSGWVIREGHPVRFRQLALTNAQSETAWTNPIVDDSASEVVRRGTEKTTAPNLHTPVSCN